MTSSISLGREVGKGQRADDGGQAEVRGQRSEGQEQKTAAYAKLRRGREDGKGQKSRQKDGGQAEVGSQKSEGQEQKMKDIRRLRRFIELATKETDVRCQKSDVGGQKESSLRETNLKEIKKYGY